MERKVRAGPFEVVWEPSGNGLVIGGWRCSTTCPPPPLRASGTRSGSSSRAYGLATRRGVTPRRGAPYSRRPRRAAARKMPRLRVRHPRTEARIRLPKSRILDQASAVSLTGETPEAVSRNIAEKLAQETVFHGPTESRRRAQGRRQHGEDAAQLADRRLRVPGGPE